MADRFRGAVFDLNGTLVDDIRFHFDAWRDLAKKLGHDMDEVLFQSFNGLKNEDIFPRLLGRSVSAEEIATLGEEKEIAYRAMYRPHLAPVAGALALLDRLHAGGVRLAVASSAPPANRAMVLEGLELLERFDVVVAAEHLPGKPAPHVFLEAARRLEIAPEECVAFEDAANGVRSAVSAGMFVVGITTNNPARTLLDAGARYAVTDFTALPEELERRLPR
ncbi:Beta-phosphoglucomutase [Labilithrix luteola]|uniref:Beta-phosphoglucomutase n=1 Tax=Labilithrix luteola TaxID=1391654 RepID=A0A0K1PWX7_9BACT|nr:HAD family phosphatase [Labilithrix luteola]AKU98035.1 Beta-phosphoglucomutase [Labilithrix luteola]